jgi:MoaA/NifB/PqqE/SkfB family radical SAM enzyme
MKGRPRFRAQVDDEGRLVLPWEAVSRFGLKPGVQLEIEDGGNHLRLRRPITHLAKVYIEPTNACNLECRACIRNVWDEPIGQMSGKTFDRIIEGLKSFSPKTSVFFGGFGEPLFHPNIVDMVARVKALGTTVELITNGTLLSPEMSRQLIEAGLDMLWASLDGATPESYADVRLGAALPEVVTNLRNFRNTLALFDDVDVYSAKPHIGIVFVAMKRNISDLPSVMRLGYELGASRFLVTHVLPYVVEMCDESLYTQALTDISYHSPLTGLDLPKLDINDLTSKTLYETMRWCHDIRFAGASLKEANDLCPFVDRGATVIGWEGVLSPCLPLLHNHVSFLHGKERVSRRYLVGNVSERDLNSLWKDPQYEAFRERVGAFDFSPCTFCGACELFEKNEEDCFCNTFPTCGGCLWAQGLIQCP